MTNKEDINKIFYPGDRVFYEPPEKNEAINSTKELHSLAKEVSEQFIPLGCSVIMFGSAAYGMNYSTNYNSDLDLEIIFKNASNFGKTNFLSKEGEKFDKQMESFLKSSAQLFLYKKNSNGKEVSLHFIKEEEFEKMVHINLLKPKNKLGFIELRNYFKGNTNYPNRCSFSGKKTEWMSTSTEINNNLFLIDLPFYQIENGLIYNGIFPEWHLAKPIFLGGNQDWYLSCEDYIFKEYVKRMVFEEETTGLKFKFTNILARKDRMSDIVINEINSKAELIRKQIK